MLKISILQFLKFIFCSETICLWLHQVIVSGGVLVSSKELDIRSDESFGLNEEESSSSKAPS